MLSANVATRILQYVDPAWIPSAAIKEALNTDTPLQQWIASFELSSFCVQCYSYIQTGARVHLECGHGVHVHCVQLGDYQRGVTTCTRCSGASVTLPPFHTIPFPLELFRMFEESTMLDVSTTWRGATDREQVMKGHATWFVPYNPVVASFQMCGGIQWENVTQVGYFQKGFLFASCSTVSTSSRRGDTTLRWCSVNVIPNDAGSRMVGAHVPTCDVLSVLSTNQQWCGWIRTAAQHQVRRYGPFSAVVFYNSAGHHCSSFVALCIQNGRLCFVESLKFAKKAAGVPEEGSIQVAMLQLVPANL